MTTKNIKNFSYLFLLFYLGSVLPAIATELTAYTVRKVEVVGNTMLDKEVIIALSGLQEGDIVHTLSSTIRESIRKISKQEAIKSIAIYLSGLDEATRLATFVIHVAEHPVLDNYLVDGLTKREKKALMEAVPISNNIALSPLFLHKTTTGIKKFFLDKGFMAVQISTDIIPNKEIIGKSTLKIKVNKGEKSIVHQIIFEGNNHLASPLLRYHMKELKEAPRFTLVKDIIQKCISLVPIREGGLLLALPKKMDDVLCYLFNHVSFFSSVFTEEQYLKAKENLIAFYQSKGFRDVRIAAAHLSRITPQKLNIHFKIEEGKCYTIRNIKWVGNDVYSNTQLHNLLRLSEERVYDPVYINSRLNPGTIDETINDLYTNNGYLFFRAKAVEVGLEDNQVDLEIRIEEGKQATINHVDIIGNTITHDYVIRRELLTLPGEKYSRVRMLKSLRNLAMLDFFKPEKLIPEIQPDEANGTVDLIYSVKEQPKFDIRASVSYTKNLVLEAVVGSNNVSLKKIFTGKGLLGDAQKVHVKSIFHYPDHQSYSISLKEPWFWLNERRYMLSMSGEWSNQVIGDTQWAPLDSLVNVGLFPFKLEHKKSQIRSIGGLLTLGKKLSNYWEGHLGINYQYHSYKHYEMFVDHKKSSGCLHDMSLTFSLIHDNTNDLNYPTYGWYCANFLALTPPYTLMGYNTSEESTIPRFKEFGKLVIDASFFQRLMGNFVLNLRGHAGFLHSLSKKDMGPFERFYLGGDIAQLSNKICNSNFIPLRGYPDNSLTPKDYKRAVEGGIIFNKFVAELRYPVTLAPACIYLLGFIEMGGTWLKYSDYNLSAMKKSIGSGIRVILPIPMIPKFGIDFGYRLDTVKNSRDRNNSFEYHLILGS